ncbi:MAG: DUF2797 domain-containing protein [Gammaproteobacteria bacterium]|nr:DUF2797 domain-containing protein [Gammaproteobacteria bacterium]
MNDSATIAQGVLRGINHRLDRRAGQVVQCDLEVGKVSVDLNALVGVWLRIAGRERITCAHCGSDTPKGYGGGYCYRCFTTLARCDLCVVSPDRCHYSRGTCREPAWGEAFCMRPHLVYLANSGAPRSASRIPTHTGSLARPGRGRGHVVVRAPPAMPRVASKSRLAAI